MDPHADHQRREFVACLVEVLGTAIRYERLEDAEDVLRTVRQLRPQLAELIVFDAWIAIRQLDWLHALRLIRGSEERILEWPLGKALLAFCQYATGDSIWMFTAEQVMTESDSEDAKGLMRLLMGQEEEEPAPADTSDFPIPPPDASATCTIDHLFDARDWRSMRA